MSKRTYNEIRKILLKTLEKESPLTYAQLERKLKTNPNTIRQHCKDLELFSTVKITKKTKHEANGRPYFIVEITSQGKKILEKINK